VDLVDAVAVAFGAVAEVQQALLEPVDLGLELGHELRGNADGHRGEVALGRAEALDAVRGQAKHAHMVVPGRQPGDLVRGDDRGVGGLQAAVDLRQQAQALQHREGLGGLLDGDVGLDGVCDPGGVRHEVVAVGKLADRDAVPVAEVVDQVAFEGPGVAEAPGGGHPLPRVVLGVGGGGLVQLDEQPEVGGLLVVELERAQVRLGGLVGEVALALDDVQQVAGRALVGVAGEQAVGVAGGGRLARGEPVLQELPVVEVLEEVGHGGLLWATRGHACGSRGGPGPKRTVDPRPGPRRGIGRQSVSAMSTAWAYTGVHGRWSRCSRLVRAPGMVTSTKECTSWLEPLNSAGFPWC
jgi:hypothetical protein